MAYKFIYVKDEQNEDENVESIVHVIRDSVTYTELLAAFEQFVRVAGFILGDKSFVVVDEDLCFDDEIPEM
jgi:hypothetical protein